MWWCVFGLGFGGGGLRLEMGPDVFGEVEEGWEGEVWEERGRRFGEGGEEEGEGGEVGGHVCCLLLSFTVSWEKVGVVSSRRNGI